MAAYLVLVMKSCFVYFIGCPRLGMVVWVRGSD